MGANIYPPAKVDGRKFREGYDRIFGKKGSEEMSYKDYEMKIGDLEEQIEELEKENKKYREALGYYENESHYDHDYCIDLGDCTPIIVDNGDKARQALNK